MIRYNSFFSLCVLYFFLILYYIFRYDKLMRLSTWKHLTHSIEWNESTHILIHFISTITYTLVRDFYVEIYFYVLCVYIKCDWIAAPDD